MDSHVTKGYPMISACTGRLIAGFVVLSLHKQGGTRVQSPQGEDWIFYF